jgi:hypothetical protein
MLAGRPHEAAGNGSPRWMAVGPRERVHRTRPTGQLARRPPLSARTRSAGGSLGCPAGQTDDLGGDVGNGAVICVHALYPTRGGLLQFAGSYPSSLDMRPQRTAYLALSESLPRRGVAAYEQHSGDSRVVALAVSSSTTRTLAVFV